MKSKRGAWGSMCDGQFTPPLRVSQEPPKPLHLLLHTLDLGAQPLDKPSQFGDLVLGVFEVIPMPACY